MFISFSEVIDFVSYNCKIIPFILPFYLAFIIIFYDFFQEPKESQTFQNLVSSAEKNSKDLPEVRFYFYRPQPVGSTERCLMRSMKLTTIVKITQRRGVNHS